MVVHDRHGQQRHDRVPNATGRARGAWAPHGWDTRHRKSNCGESRAGLSRGNLSGPRAQSGAHALERGACIHTVSSKTLEHLATAIFTAGARCPLASTTRRHALRPPSTTPRGHQLRGRAFSSSGLPGTGPPSPRQIAASSMPPRPAGAPRIDGPQLPLRAYQRPCAARAAAAASSPPRRRSRRWHPCLPGPLPRLHLHAWTACARITTDSSSIGMLLAAGLLSAGRTARG